MPAVHRGQGDDRLAFADRGHKACFVHPRHGFIRAFEHHPLVACVQRHHRVLQLVRLVFGQLQLVQLEVHFLDRNGLNGHAAGSLCLLAGVGDDLARSRRDGDDHAVLRDPRHILIGGHPAHERPRAIGLHGGGELPDVAGAHGKLRLADRERVNFRRACHRLSHGQVVRAGQVALGADAQEVGRPPCEVGLQPEVPLVGREGVFREGDFMAIGIQKIPLRVDLRGGFHHVGAGRGRFEGVPVGIVGAGDHLVVAVREVFQLDRAVKASTQRVAHDLDRAAYAVFNNEQVLCARDQARGETEPCPFGDGQGAAVLVERAGCAVRAEKAEGIEVV